MQVVRVFTGSDDQSHFEDIDITVGNGTQRRLGPGEILLAEDLTGQGNKSQAVDGQLRSCLFIPIDDDETVS